MVDASRLQSKKICIGTLFFLHGARPREGRVSPQDLTATALKCLGFAADAEIRDNLGRPIPASRGKAIKAVL